jgi:anti-sigma factor RsiW
VNCDVTYEELAAYVAGEASPDRVEVLRTHHAQCERCRSRIAALRRSDALLAATHRPEPGVEALLATRRALTRTIRRLQVSEIMTLEDVAAFLRIDADALEDIAEELPAFELGGQIRVRRQKLIEWIEQREQSYARGAAAGLAGRASAGWLSEGEMA